MSEAFKPEKHLRELRGRGGTADYLDVKWRIVWLRHEHPAAIIETEKIAGGMESNYAEFRARVSIPGGGSASGHGSETKADFGDFIEKAETKAIGRAIAALGYGTQFVGNELDENTRIVDAPVERGEGNAAADPLGPVLDHLAGMDSRNEPYANIKQYATERWAAWSPLEQQRVTAAMQAIKGRREAAGIHA